jgi:hypothetical protein
LKLAAVLLKQIARQSEQVTATAHGFENIARFNQQLILRKLPSGAAARAFYL